MDLPVLLARHWPEEWVLTRPGGRASRSSTSPKWLGDGNKGPPTMTIPCGNSALSRARTRNQVLIKFAHQFHELLVRWRSTPTTAISHPKCARSWISSPSALRRPPRGIEARQSGRIPLEVERTLTACPGSAANKTSEVKPEDRDELRRRSRHGHTFPPVLKAHDPHATRPAGPVLRLDRPPK